MILVQGFGVGIGYRRRGVRPAGSRGWGWRHDGGRRGWRRDALASPIRDALLMLAPRGHLYLHRPISTGPACDLNFARDIYNSTTQDINFVSVAE